MDKFGLRELLRYGYAGFVFAIVAGLVAPDETREAIADLGGVLSPLVAVAVGAIVYLVFRGLVGDLFLWKLVHWLHSSVSDRCKVAYLKRVHNVSCCKGLDAYTLIRDQLLKPGIRERFHVQHSEVHLLSITWFLCLLASLLAFVGVFPHAVSWSKWGLLGAGLATCVASLVHEITLCRAERAALGVLEEGGEAVREPDTPDVATIVRAGGFLSTRTKQKPRSI